MIGDGGSMGIFTIIPVDEILSKGVPLRMKNTSKYL